MRMIHDELSGSSCVCMVTPNPLLRRRVLESSSGTARAGRVKHGMGCKKKGWASGGAVVEPARAREDSGFVRLH